MLRTYKLFNKYVRLYLINTYIYGNMYMPKGKRKQVNGGKKMIIYYKEKNRKDLVKAISDFTRADSRYLGTPSYAYSIDYFTVTREGNLEFDDMADSEEIENLIEYLYEKGFMAEENTKNSAYTLELDFPKDTFDELGVENAKKIIISKEKLIKKSLGAREIKVLELDNVIRFEIHFERLQNTLVLKSVQKFIAKLVVLAKNQKRVTAKEKEYKNEKYAFRCFLLRLGFIGKEYKEDRKILLQNLVGSSAFKERR